MLLLTLLPDQCESVLLWYLIEDLLESQSIEGCRSMFDYLESRRERLIAVCFYHRPARKKTNGCRNTSRESNW